MRGCDLGGTTTIAFYSLGYQCDHKYSQRTRLLAKKGAYCIIYYHRKVNTKMDGIMTVVCATIWDKGKWIIIVVQVQSDIEQPIHPGAFSPRETIKH